MATAELELTLAPAIPPFPLRRFTVAEYHKLAESGLLQSGAPLELLEGWIVPKMTRRPLHDGTLDLLDELLRRQLPEGWRLRVQAAITTSDSEPEPDFSVVRGRADTYLHRHPGPEDIVLVIEVAESSLAHDRTVKGRIYARAGIVVYWVVNLVDGIVEVYSDPSGPVSEPSYRQHRDYSIQEVIPLVINGNTAHISVREVLPLFSEG
jgi:Uma2 family endonuclease